MIYTLKGKNSSYQIIIEKGSINKIPLFIKENQKVMIVTDDGVPSLYIDQILKLIKAEVFIFNQGEASKSLATYTKLIERLSKLNFSRDDVLIALGGGVVGDLTLFSGSTYKRGIKVIMVPTTTLAMCDSSVGGKSALNSNSFKNIIGSFYDPYVVIVDVDVLKTLEKKHFYNGLFEALKMGMIANEELFNYFYLNTYEENIERVISLSIFHKKEIVELDYLEKDIRRALNFGHTIGHALESYYKFNLLHGEAIAYGMMLSLKDKEIKDKLQVALSNLELKPIKLPKFNELKGFISNDKKVESDLINFVSVNKIGSYTINKISINELKEIIEVD